MPAFASRPPLLFACLLALAGCAGPTTRPAHLDPAAVALEAERQRDIALKDRLELQSRLSRVAWPILRAGTPLCEQRVRWMSGAVFVTRGDLPAEEAEAAARLLGIGERLGVLVVVDGSPAARAGLEPGDELVSFNGTDLAGGNPSGRRFAESLEKALEGGQPASFGLRRNGAPLTVTVAPEQLCDYPAVVVDGAEVNAYADGEAIYFTRGMTRFAARDEELALIVGHELAHNVMGHIDAKRLNAGIGLLFDLLAAAGGVNTQGAFSNLGAMAYSKDFEEEADYVGLYLTALAGVDVTDAADFWRKMATLSPEGIESAYGSTHPSHPERFLHIEQSVAEVNTKRAAGLSLVPEARPDDPAAREEPAAASRVGFGR